MPAIEMTNEVDLGHPRSPWNTVSIFKQLTGCSETESTLTLTEGVEAQVPLATHFQQRVLPAGEKVQVSGAKRFGDSRDAE